MELNPGYLLKPFLLYHSSKVDFFFHSFFGRIEDTKKTFRNELTFFYLLKNLTSDVNGPFGIWKDNFCRPMRNIMTCINRSSICNRVNLIMFLVK